MLPPRRGGVQSPVLSRARRSAAVRMGRGGTARPPEAEWSSGVAAFFGGGVITKIFSKFQTNATTTTSSYYTIYCIRSNKDANSRLFTTANAKPLGSFIHI